MKIYIAADHAGFKLKEILKDKIKGLIDLGTFSEEPVDYPIYIQKLCEKMLVDKNSMGILVCGSGQGMCIGANRYSHIRAVECSNEACAQITRQHNDANVLCLGERYISTEDALRITETFLNTKFSDELRHHRRIEALSKLTSTTKTPLSTKIVNGLIFAFSYAFSYMLTIGIVLLNKHYKWIDDMQFFVLITTVTVVVSAIYLHYLFDIKSKKNRL